MIAYGRNEGRVDPRGTQRRIQGLQLLGWRADHIGDAAHGMKAEVVRRTLTATWVQAGTRDRIRHATTVLLKHGAGPSEITAHRSRVKKWVPLMAWDAIDTDLRPAETVTGVTVDDIAVTIALTGTRVALTATERRAAVTKLHAEKWSDPLIAETLHCASETVQRDRRKLGLDAWPYYELEKRGAA